MCNENNTTKKDQTIAIIFQMVVLEISEWKISRLPAIDSK